MGRFQLPKGAQVTDDPSVAPAPVAAAAAPMGKFKLPVGAQVTDDPSAPPTATAPAPEAEEPGYLEAIGRSVKQGATLGFGDELTAAFESAFTDKTYKQARAEARAADAAAKKAHPIVFGLGEVLGGALPAIATGGAGAGLAGALKVGAGFGAAAAAGESEADLTEGEFKRFASETATGGLWGGALGGAAHGLGRGLSYILGSKGEGLVAGAATRADKQLAGDLLEKVPARTQDKALGSIARAAGREPAHGREELARLIRGDESLLKAKSSGTAEFVAEVKSQKEALGQGIGKTIEAVDAAAPGDKGIPLVDVLRPMNQMRAEAKKAGDLARMRAIDRETDGVVDAWRDRNVDKGIAHVPAADVHQLVQRYGRGGFEGGSFENPTAAKELGRDLWAGVREELHSHVERVANQHGLVGDLQQLKMLNRRYQQLSAIEDLAEAQATRAARNSPTLGERLGHFGKGAAIVGGLASGHGLATAAAYGAAKAAPIVARGANQALAALVRAARAGSVPAGLVQNAIEAGVPRGTIAAIAGSTAAPPETEPMEEASP